MKAIVAIDIKGEIGNGKDLLHRCKEDMAFFKKVTMGKTLIMGRKTFDSLPIGGLPGRRLLVLTRGVHYTGTENEYFFTSKEEVLEYLLESNINKEDVFIAGGAQIYKLFEEEIDEVWTSLILKSTNNKDNISFPIAMDDSWDIVKEDTHMLSDCVQFIKYRRARGPVKFKSQEEKDLYKETIVETRSMEITGDYYRYEVVDLYSQHREEFHREPYLEVTSLDGKKEIDFWDNHSYLGHIARKGFATDKNKIFEKDGKAIVVLLQEALEKGWFS